MSRWFFALLAFGAGLAIGCAYNGVGDPLSFAGAMIGAALTALVSIAVVQHGRAVERREAREDAAVTVEQISEALSELAKPFVPNPQDAYPYNARLIAVRGACQSLKADILEIDRELRRSVGPDQAFRKLYATFPRLAEIAENFERVSTQPVFYQDDLARLLAVAQGDVLDAKLKAASATSSLRGTLPVVVN